MISSFNFDSVTFYDRSDNIIGPENRPFIYSDKLKNEFLGMMYAHIAKIESDKVENMMDLNEYSPEVIGVLASMSMMQIEDSQSEVTDAEILSYIGTTKMGVLRLPNQCTKIIFRNSKDSLDPDYVIDLIEDLKFRVDSATQVEKMVLICMSSKDNTEFSRMIHESSYIPHSDLDSKILTNAYFSNKMSLLEIDENLYNQHAKIKLGDYLESFETENEKPILTPNDSMEKLYISNKYYGI